MLACALFVLALFPSAASAGAEQPVLVATRDLGSGTTVRAGDVRVRRLPSTAVPESALTAPPQAVGKLLTGGLRRGEQLTSARVTGAAHARGGSAAVPVRLTDPAMADLLRPGMRVDVLSAAPDGVSPSSTGAGGGGQNGGDPNNANPNGGDTGRVLATGAHVLAVPHAEATQQQERMVLLSLPTASAHRVAAASLRQDVTLTLR